MSRDIREKDLLVMKKSSWHIEDEVLQVKRIDNDEIEYGSNVRMLKNMKQEVKAVLRPNKDFTQYTKI